MMLRKIFGCGRERVAGMMMGVAVLLAGANGAVAQENPPPAVPAFETDDDAPGKIVVMVTYDGTGKVENCRIIRSNAPYNLELATIDQIRKHWNVPLFAGGTVIVPIHFTETPAPEPWSPEMKPPPDLFPYDDKKYELKLRLTFASDGWIKKFDVVQKSGSDLADLQTGEWIMAHWHHADYANQVIDAPFEFVRASPPAPLPPPLPPAKRSKPGASSEPVAIPAIRVQ